ncbi:NAD(P)/FAD-dependent oxidoreductase [Streptomyces sp. NPDC087263]|uniref:NAD(P)/FAD-dependent oxidoreductase n=1 Tax=Streptomyces sp. NPDC087263 TaxID=3365773 RepID=UPI0037F74949
MTTSGRVVVVGASAAGLTTAQSARTQGYTGEIVLVGEEPEEPYDRPPLSKQLLSGDWEPDRLTLRPRADLDKLALDLRLGVRASAVDTAARTVALADGSSLTYDTLVIATGVTPARLPFGHDLGGVHILRGLRDALRLRTELRTARRLVVIGAGFLGAEVAAVARGLGVDVTLADPQPLPLLRALGAEVGGMLADVHRDNGVDLRCGTGVRALHGREGRVREVELDDGTTVPADAVLVAIGSKPEVGWLAGSGIPLGNGVLCDEHGQVLPGVFAVGDVAAWRDPRTGRHHRVEHRMTATDHGRIVGRALAGTAPTETPLIPYFWSDQYDLKLQSYGLPSADREFTVVEGSLAERRFVAVYGGSTGEENVVRAVVASGMPRQLRTWRQSVVDTAPWPRPASVGPY